MRGWLQTLVRFPRVTLGALAILVLVGGVVVAASGVIPIKASSGHWAITEWFLQFSKRRSVATHAMLVGAPPQPLETQALIMRGAGHFETGCRPCHGAPGDPLPRIARAMTPTPPALAPRVPLWTSRQLFYIVKHGIKLTGMPAWPALSRDDEVWAMVAFLRQLPLLDETSYGALVRGDESTLMEMFAGTTPTESPPDIVLEVCARCHGMDGRGRGVGAFPKLAGQRLGYLTRSMHAYVDGRRHSGIMEPIASGLPEEARHAALRYYTSLPPASDPVVSSEAAARGEEIALRGMPSQEIPSCASCHGPRAHEVNDAYPRLAGQHAEYISQQLKLLRERHRGGTEYVEIMHNFVDRLTEEQIDDVAAYYAGGSRRSRPGG